MNPYQILFDFFSDNEFVLVRLQLVSMLKMFFATNAKVLS
jgi:hypothetical protein